MLIWEEKIRNKKKEERQDRQYYVKIRVGILWLQFFLSELNIYVYFNNYKHLHCILAYFKATFL